MDIHYCKQWFRYNKYPTDMLTEEQARKRYDKSKLFTALLGSATHPFCFLEFSAYRSVCVEFLDEHLRTYLVHSFQEKKPSTFFLSTGTRRSYLLSTDQMVRGDVFHFKVDGKLYIERCTVDLKTDN